jgi:hypothetical protein
MLLQLRVLNSQGFEEGEVFSFRGNIIRVSWESDGRLSPGRTRRPLLIFYGQESGCRVRCFPPEALKLNGLPLEREQHLNPGDQIERPDGLVLVVSDLQLKEEREAVFVIADGKGKRFARASACLPRAAIALVTCALVLGTVLGNLREEASLQPPAPGPKPLASSAMDDRAVRDVALELKETLSQASESRNASVEELLVTLASARRVAQQLGRLHSEDPLAVTVATAVNSFYQISQGIVAEDPVAFQAALDSAGRCLSMAPPDRSDELVLFYRALAGISRREAETRLREDRPQATLSALP